MIEHGKGVAALVLATAVGLGLAGCGGGTQAPTPEQSKAYDKNIAPIGQVTLAGQAPAAGSAPAAPPAAAPKPAPKAAAPAPAAKPAAAQAAKGAAGGVDLAKGKAIVTKTCFACHGTGAAGAPKIGDKAAWAPRIAQGMDTLFQHATTGLRAMPPKGTCMSCSDADLRSAIAYMVQQSK